MKSALTEEEWTDALRELESGRLAPMSDAGEESSRADLIEDSVNGIERPRFHRAAALTLYGQPFGFTREDVNLLRRAANFGASYFHPVPSMPQVQHLPEHVNLNALADRIEALLPPA